MPKKETHIVYGFEVKCTEKQAEIMQICYEEECYWHKMMRKYFHVWKHYPYGVFFFVKEKYFVSYNGETDYAIALLNYSGVNAEKTSVGKAPFCWYE